MQLKNKIYKITFPGDILSPKYIRANNLVSLYRILHLQNIFFQDVSEVSIINESVSIDTIENLKKDLIFKSLKSFTENIK